jgi:ribosomal protein S18 acetylase RimI-like enzyme
MLENLSAKMLKKDELYKLKRIYKLNESPRDPTKSLLSAAVIQLPDETIVGMLGFELIPHAGPLWVKPEFRRNGLAVALYQMIESQLSQNHGTGYYTFMSNDASKALAQKLGLEKLPWEVWKREY